MIARDIRHIVVIEPKPPLAHRVVGIVAIAAIVSAWIGDGSCRASGGR